MCDDVLHQVLLENHMFKFFNVFYLIAIINLIYVTFIQIRLKPEKCSKVIIACAVLHNLAKLWGESKVLPEDKLRYVETPAYIGHQDGRGIRDHIANN
ncbi:hypothetical protein DPMN_179561 [Dreissena polymorpha]|uniref:Uncharacterized protein n=1 Tax=Dreissena polymorpha TaxID=45954 RepID=A0A9D4EEZ5_DREPO|nr:hypothetical protein DPMN_179561 [Dreissena polymorpha]